MMDLRYLNSVVRIAIIIAKFSATKIRILSDISLTLRKQILEHIVILSLLQHILIYVFYRRGIRIPREKVLFY